MSWTLEGLTPMLCAIASINILITPFPLREHYTNNNACNEDVASFSLPIALLNGKTTRGPSAWMPHIVPQGCNVARGDPGEVKLAVFGPAVNFR